MNKYSIGPALKTIRKELGLTQEQMVGNVITQTYYSKVENGKAQIGAKLLFQILNLHNYDISKFYERFISSGSENKSAFWYFESEMVNIGNSKDAKGLNKIKQELRDIEDSNIEGIDTLKLLLAVDEVLVKGTNQGISQETKDLAKRLIRGRDGNSCVYVLLQASMLLFDVDEGYVLMMEAIKFYHHDKDRYEEDTLQLAMAATNYVKTCWMKKADKKYALPVINFIKNLPQASIYIGVKLLADYYEALFNHEDAKVRMIRQIFKDSKAYLAIKDTVQDDD